MRKKPVVVTGDMNVAHAEIDLKNPKSNRKNAGFTDEERGNLPNFWMRDLSIHSAISIPIRRDLLLVVVSV